jgi:uncharacterized protein YndB with AHSA1/START domain
MKISVITEVNSSLSQVWHAWVTPEDITKWNYASDDWCCPKAELNFEVGGKFSYRMEARDGSAGFDFEGIFTKITPKEAIHFRLEDERLITIDFKETINGVTVIESFDAEGEYAAEQQRQGWQAILNNFKRHVEAKGS